MLLTQGPGQVTEVTEVTSVPLVMTGRNEMAYIDSSDNLFLVSVQCLREQKLCDLPRAVRCGLAYGSFRDALNRDSADGYCFN